MKAHGLFGHHRQNGSSSPFSSNCNDNCIHQQYYIMHFPVEIGSHSRSNILFCLALYQLLRGLYEPLTDLLLKALYALLLRQIC